MEMIITRLGVLCSFIPLVVAGLSTAAHAQMTAGCSDFAELAMRAESRGLMGSTKIVRGPAGDEVMKLGYRTGRFENLMQVSDSALVYAIDYGRSARRGSVLVGLAFVISFATPLLVDFDDARNDGIKWTSRGLSFALGFWGTASQRHASRSLSRALWHYNVAQHNAVAGCIETNTAERPDDMTAGVGTGAQQP